MEREKEKGSNGMIKERILKSYESTIPKLTKY